jgi:hypothetical protein
MQGNAKKYHSDNITNFWDCLVLHGRYEAHEIMRALNTKFTGMYSKILMFDMETWESILHVCVELEMPFCYKLLCTRTLVRVHSNQQLLSKYWPEMRTLYGCTIVQLLCNNLYSSHPMAQVHVLALLYQISIGFHTIVFQALKHSTKVRWYLLDVHVLPV